MSVTHRESDGIKRSNIVTGVPLGTTETVAWTLLGAVVNNVILSERSTMENLIPDDDQRRIQRALNEAKKRELKEKYGADFSNGESKLPPEMEADWLHYIEEFERQYQNAEQVTVREFIGNPTIKPLADIPPEELQSELDRVLDVMAEHNVGLDFLCEVSLQEQYRFITEELFNEEMDDMRIEGMNHNFIYEEFHPNDEYDAKMFSKNFLDYLFNRDREFIMHTLAKDELYDPGGNAITPDQMRSSIEAFFEKIATISSSNIDVTQCVVEGDYAVVKYNTDWTGFEAGTMKRVAASGEARLRMKRSPYGGWDVVQASVPGWNC